MDVVFQKDKHNKKPSDSGVFSKIKNYLIGVFKNFDSNFYFFLIMVVMGVIFFADSLFNNQFTTLFGGDYTAQQLSFYTNGYDDWWHFFTTGEFVFFDTNTYLGASNIGSNSFYYLFDPFFIPILLCPREFIAQGMAILTIFKIATSGMFFMMYMQYMGASKKAARISAFAYAFNGWMSWFLWFNHMTEICIVFPLMLMGVEKVLREKKPWLLMFSTFLMGITNYFFLIGMGIAAFIYAIFRWIQRFKLNSVKDNFEMLGLGFIGFLAGILMSGFVALPSILTSIEAPRSQNSNYLDLLKDALEKKDFGKFLSVIFDWNNFDFGGPSRFRHAYPLINFCFPCASCRGTPLTQFGNESYDNVATNIYSYVPMMLFFFPAFVRAMKNKKWSAIVAVVLMLFALETPFCYYMFFGFTAPYGRWELFFITSFITFSGLHIDHLDEDPMWSKIVSYIFIIALVICAGAVAQRIIDTNDNFTQRSPYLSATKATIIMCLYVTFVTVILILIKKKDSRHSWLMAFVAFEAAVMGYATIEGHWCGSFLDANNGLEYNNVLYQVNRRISKDDKSYYRAWSYLQNEGGRNDGMRNNYNGLGCFHSIYNFELNNFLNWTRIQDGSTFYGSGSWAGSYVWKNADIDKFLGVKYYFIQNNSPQWAWMCGNPNDLSYWNDEQDKAYQYNVPLDFEDVTNQYPNEKFQVFRDKNPINFGVGYDSIISYDTEENSVESTYDSFSMYSSQAVLRNDELLLEGAILNTETAQKLAETHTNLKITKVEDARTFEKTLLGSCVKEFYDLNQSNDGKIYTVNTFFEEYANSYLGQAHAMTKEQLVNIDNGNFKKVDFAENENQYYGRYVSVFKPNVGDYFSSFYDEKGYSVYIPYNYSENYGSDIYLIDTNGNIITWDRHQDDKYNIGGEKYRGFFVHAQAENPAPKLAKIIVCHREKSSTSVFSTAKIYTETYAQQQARYSKLYENQLSDVVYKTNKFTFKSNYTTNKFVVTQMPYEKGWSIKAKLPDGTKKNLEVYSVQGGYTGFVAEIGDVEYSMEFYPQYLKEGKILSTLGATMFLGTAIGYYFYNYEYKKKEKILADLSL